MQGHAAPRFSLSVFLCLCQSIGRVCWQGDPGGSLSSDALSSLHAILDRTESGLRAKGEAVLRSVEDNRINTLPAVASAPGSGGFPPRYTGDFDLASAIVAPVPKNAMVPSSIRAAPVDGVQLASPSRRQATLLSSQLAHMRRPVAERMAEARAMELMARAPTEAQLGGGYASGGAAYGPAREFVHSKFALSPGSDGAAAAAAAAPSPSVSGTRPIERYGRTWREQRVHKGPLAVASVLPKIYRANPRAYPSIGPDDAGRGVLSLVQRGFIPPFVDVTSAFASAPAPLTQAPVTFHNHADQFKRPAAHAQEPFSLASVRLDLGEALLDTATPNEFEREMEERERRQQQQQQLLLQEEKQQQQQQPLLLEPPAGANGSSEWRAAPATQFDFPRLMPGNDEAQGRMSPAGGGFADDVEDLLAADDAARAHPHRLDGPSAASPGDDGQVREYDELLDTYSLHQFLIRKGKTLSSTPEFQSFARKNAPQWPQVRTVLAALERLCRDYRITVATVAGAQVVALAEDKMAALTPERLFKCFQLDIHAGASAAAGQMDPVLRALLAAPAAARYAIGGEAARVMAALAIQSTWRMFVQRRLYLLHRHRHVQAALIQRAWRRFQTLLRTRATIGARWATKLEAWRAMQSAWRKNWSSFQSRRRVHVHVPSSSLEAHQRASTFNFAVRENSQLSRLCDAHDPNVDVLYLSPFALSPDVQNYYLKLLEVGGVAAVHSRVKVMVPENAPRFPEHFSLAKLALYSPRLLRKIREHVRGRPAMLVPGDVGPEDLLLAVELGLPLLGAEPDTLSLFGSKSGSKRIFAAAEVAVAPGAHDIYDEADLLAYLSKLMVEHLDVQRWLLKIDNEAGGRGVAMVDTARFKVMAAVRAEKAQHANRWHLPEVVANAQERVAVALRKGLARKAVLACPGLYDSRWSAYAAAYFRVGGVIEACPPFVVGSPSVNMLIEPDGSVALLSSHDQIFSSPFVFAAANFPSGAPADLLHPAALAIARQAYREGVIGYVGVDFVAWSAGGGPGARGGGGGAPRLWAVDLNLRLTPTQASFQLFDFLAKGRYVYQHHLLAPGLSRAERDAVPLHLRPPAKYLVKNGADASATTLQRSASRSGGSGAAAARGLSAAAGGGLDRDSSRPGSGSGSGSSTPKLPDLGRGGGSSSSLRSVVASSESERFYSCVPYLYQPHLATLQFGSFFQACRLRGVAFDVRARMGTAFVLMDSLASGTLGLLCVGTGEAPGAGGASASASASASGAVSLSSSPLHAMQLLVETLSFLHEQVSSLRLGPHLFDDQSNLAALLAAFRGLVKAQREANQWLLLEQHAALADATAAGAANS